VVPPSAEVVPILAPELQAGIAGEEDLFGGVVPHRFLANKAITHPLPGPDAAAPKGWVPDFAAAISGAVLAGFSAFSAEDALSAGKRLLRRGSVRLKPTEGRGGCGQLVIADLSSLRRALDALDPRKLAEDGIVLEEHLSEVATFSVGEIRVAGTILSYLGLQRLTTDNAGQAVYGGSDLEFVRGSLDELAASALSSQARLAVERARAYDRAAAKYYPAIVASRRNYDVAVGVDGAGRHVLGVLEQSWRIGGASPAEVLALEQFGRQPSLKTVRAATVEVYGEPAAVPADAMLFYHGEDAEAGPITKYARILGDGNGEQQS
jgi:hypothetical protein